MTSSDDLDRLLAGWLREDGTEVLRREVSLAALADARRRPQARWLGRSAPLRLRRPLVWVALVALLVGLGLFVAMLAGSPPKVDTRVPLGMFTVTGPMSVARVGHAAIPLQDGRVLIVGGSSSGADLTGAELYDPRSGAFSPTGSMSTVRTSGTFTLLRDGRVLVTGGADAESVMDSAELYDPTSGTFSPTGSMATPRKDHTATLLLDGRVLLAGGRASWNDTTDLASAELFDPTTGRFAQTSAMTTARAVHHAVLLADGRVLVLGGAGPSAELYDPVEGTFSPIAAPFTPTCCALEATLLGDGTVLVGGSPDRAPVTLRFDPVSESFERTGPPLVPRVGATWTLLADRRVLVAGGGDFRREFGQGCMPMLETTEIYDPGPGTFGEGPVMTSARSGHTATLLDDGGVLVAGGGCNGPTVTAEVYR